MAYLLLIKRQAKKMLQSLSRTDRNRITEKIMLLATTPDHESLDIKLLQGWSYYRLRVGDWRIIFDRDEETNTISIDKIKPRGDVYK